MHIKKIFRLFLALPVILIFLTGCEPSTERIPKEEKAKLEFREKRAAEVEAAAAELILKLEKEEAEAKRKAEEKARYIAENTKSTYLYCPSLNERIVKANIDPEIKCESERSDGGGLFSSDKPCTAMPEKILEPEKNLGPVQIALVEIKKLQGDKTKLEELDISNEFLKTTAYWDIPMFKNVSNWFESGKKINNNMFSDQNWDLAKLIISQNEN